MATRLKDTIKNTALDGVCYTLGSVLYAASVVCFAKPNQLVNGGVTGVAQLLNVLFSVPVGLSVFVLNIPLLLLALWKLGWRFTLRTVLCTTLCSVMIDVLDLLLPPFTGDRMLAALFGGLLAGTGLGLLYLRGATSGGVDIVSRLLEQRYPHLSMGRLLLLLDAAVVAASAVVFRNIEVALYALVLIFVGSYLIDTLLYGRDAGKLVLVVTDKCDLAPRIMVALHRGVTTWQVTGAYTGETRLLLLCAVSRPQVYPLRRLVSEQDPAAFIITASTDEVRGLGFKVE